MSVPASWKRPAVKLIGQDGNAFGILGRCQRAARKAGNSAEDVETFVAEATSGDYSHLLAVVQEWFEVS
jgi:hypothetical protein